jgi:hypothetical protein
MTISATIPTRHNSSGNGSATSFSYTVKIAASSDLKLVHTTSAGVETTLVNNTDYTVNGAGDAGGGTVDFPKGGSSYSTLASGEKLAIIYAYPIEQTTDLPNTGRIFNESVEDQLDYITVLNNQHEEKFDRAVLLTEGSTMTGLTMPEGADANARKNKAIIWNEAGNDFELGSSIGLNRGNWATSTAYNARDIIKDTSNNNIYWCNTDHTSSGSQPISSNTDVAKWDLIVDAAAAATSATAAATSATAAAASATAAAASETAAETAETNAETAETNAETAETNAETAETNAETAETNAASSATAAASSATSAASSATSATSSASTATTQASNASTSASAASTSASNASTSASNASTSASAASTSETNTTASVGALAWKYTFDSSTTMADPGAGEIRFDNATVASVTNLAMDATSADTGNPDVSDLIASIDDGSNDTHEGYVTIRKSGTPATFACYSVTGAVTDSTGWLQVPVTHVASNGTISNTDTLYISFVRTGAKGATGATGPAGAGSDTPPDNVFRIQDNVDTTKQIAFEASGISTSTTRTITMPDRDITLGTTLGTNNILTNAKTISENITFAGTENGLCVGEIAIANGYTVVVSNGSRWTIL